MTNVLFEGGSPITFDPPSDEPEDFTCALCQQPLAYSGRGRKPKKCSSTNGGNPECYGITSARPATGTGTRVSARHSKNVETALAVMDGFYDELSQILMLLAPSGAVELESRVTKQQLRNRVSFEASPVLCERVAKWGGKGGTFSFLFSNVCMLGMVAFTVYNGTSAQIAAFQAMAAAMGNGNGTSPDGPQFDLGKLFNMG